MTWLEVFTRWIDLIGWQSVDLADTSSLTLWHILHKTSEVGALRIRSRLSDNRIVGWLSQRS